MKIYNIGNIIPKLQNISNRIRFPHLDDTVPIHKIIYGIKQVQFFNQFISPGFHLDTVSPYTPHHPFKSFQNSQTHEEDVEIFIKNFQHFSDDFSPDDFLYFLEKNFSIEMFNQTFRQTIENHSKFFKHFSETPDRFFSVLKFCFHSETCCFYFSAIAQSIFESTLGLPIFEKLLQADYIYDFYLTTKLLVQQFDRDSVLYPFLKTDGEAFILIQQIHYLTIFQENDLSKTFHQFREK